MSSGICEIMTLLHSGKTNSGTNSRNSNIFLKIAENAQTSNHAEEVVLGMTIVCIAWG
jgi:hypothetical protein